jgi:hypothetical protein
MPKGPSDPKRLECDNDKARFEKKRGEAGKGETQRRSGQMNLAAVAAAFICLTAAARADVLDQMDETSLSVEVKDECHIQMPEPERTTEQGSRIDAKLDALGKVAWHQIWDELDSNAPSDHEQNGRKAEYILRKRMEEDLGKGRALVAEKGCAALTPHAREVLESYLQ